MGRDQVIRLMAIVGIEGVRRGEHRTFATVGRPGNPPSPGPGQAGLGPAQPSGPRVGRRFPTCVDAGRLLLCQLRDRRVLQAHTVLEGEHVQDHTRGGLGPVRPASSQLLFHGHGPGPSAGAGSQYTFIAFTQALVEAGIAGSIGTVGRCPGHCPHGITSHAHRG